MGLFNKDRIGEIHTDYIFGNVLGDTLRVFTDDNSPVYQLLDLLSCM